jgi:AcrR family transcriptional regulator
MPSKKSGQVSQRQTARKLQRGRGRPQATDPSGDDLRALIVAAARDVYAEHGYHGSTVEQILQASGVSRPTFYRQFQDRREVLDVVIEQTNDVLRDIVTEMTLQVNSLEEVITASIDAYFEWGERIGALMGPIYREIYDPVSPASKHRQRLLGEFNQLFDGLMASLGRVRFEPIVYDTLLHVIEHVGHQAFWPKRQSPQQISHRRQLISRIMFATLALPEEFEQLPSTEDLQVGCG